MLARSIEEQVEPKDYAVMLCQHIKSLMRELRQTYGQPARDSRFRLWSKPDHVTELAQILNQYLEASTKEARQSYRPQI